MAARRPWQKHLHWPVDMSGSPVPSGAGRLSAGWRRGKGRVKKRVRYHGIGEDEQGAVQAWKRGGNGAGDCCHILSSWT